MKPFVLISLTITLLAIGAGLFLQENAESGEASPLWDSFEGGLQRAKKENRKILIDVYTDWCGWCKKMDREVYSSQDVIHILGSRFVAIKLNAESNRSIVFNGTTVTEAEFARGAGVTGYPTTLFLDPQAVPITSLPGYVNASRFKKILTYIGDNHYLTTSFQDYIARSDSPGR